MDLVLQPWLANLTFMQQTVLLTAIRGPDSIEKYHDVKFLLRWYRRCILYSALDRCIWDNPCARGGGSFTGPSSNGSVDYWEVELDRFVDSYLRSLDAIPHHFHMHLMHAVEILGYKHPTERTKTWWCNVYLRFVNDMHLCPEPEEMMDYRLGDKFDQWRERSDPATMA